MPSFRLLVPATALLPGLAPQSGIARRRARVERGQVLAYVAPSYTAAERGALAQNAAELDAQIAILQAPAAMIWCCAAARNG